MLEHLRGDRPALSFGDNGRLLKRCSICILFFVTFSTHLGNCSLLFLSFRRFLTVLFAHLPLLYSLSCDHFFLLYSLLRSVFV